MPIRLSEFKSYGNSTLTGNFFGLLQRLETSLPIPNLFVVEFDIPERINDLEEWYTGDTYLYNNVDVAREVFTDPSVYKNKGFALCNGIDVNTEKNSINQLGPTGTKGVNGFLPISVHGSRDFDATDLGVQFIESVVSVADFIFKPWIRFAARYGGFSDTNLHTDLNIYYLERNNTGRFVDVNDSTIQPLIRKQYTFYNCIPISVDAEGKQAYDDEPSLVNKLVKWKFDKYDIKLPVR